jgi:hypothetical protein
MSVMLILGVLLVAVPLYLWQRPKKSETTKESEQPAASAPVLLPPSAPPADKVAGAQLGEMRVLSCRDARRAAEECDRVLSFEQAFGKAITDAAQCLPESAAGGTVQYVAEVHFGRRKVSLSAPRDGRTIRNAKLLTTCVATIRKSLDNFAFDGVQHGHLRYRVAVIATYATAASGPAGGSSASAAGKP